MDRIQIKTPIGNLMGSTPSIIMGSGIALVLIGAMFVKTSEFHVTLVISAGLLLLVIGGTMAGWLYLKGEVKGQQKTPDEIKSYFLKYDEAIEGISDDISKIVERIDLTPVSTVKQPIEFSSAERKNLIKILQEKIAEDISKDLFEELITKSQSIELDRTQIINLRTREDQTKERLLNEIDALSRRGNLNLVIGVVTTILAVGLLAYIVLTAKFDVNDTATFLKHYLPRITVAVFIEIFSFFFLKLYRQSLSEIKYFQNEMTNVDSKFLSLESSILIKDREAILYVINQLASTERNFVLQKGQSTVELEKVRYEKEGMKELMNSAKDILKIKRKTN